MNDLHNFDNAEILAAERLAIEAAVIIAELNQEEYDVAVSNHSTIEIRKSLQEKLVNTWAKRYVRTKRKRYTMQLFKRIGKCAAMAFALLCIFTTVLYVTVDAARVGITNFFVEKFDKYSDITFQPNEGGNILENDILVSWDKQHELVSFIHMETCFLQYRFTQIFRVCRLILKTVQKKSRSQWRISCFIFEAR